MFNENDRKNLILKKIQEMIVDENEDTRIVAVYLLSKISKLFD